ARRSRKSAVGSIVSKPCNARIGRPLPRRSTFSSIPCTVSRSSSILESFSGRAVVVCIAAIDPVENRSSAPKRFPDGREKICGDSPTRGGFRLKLTQYHNLVPVRPLSRQAIPSGEQGAKALPAAEWQRKSERVAWGRIKSFSRLAHSLL